MEEVQLYVIMNATGGLVTMTADPNALSNWRNTNVHNAASGLPVYQILLVLATDVTDLFAAQLPVMPDE